MSNLANLDLATLHALLERERANLHHLELQKADYADAQVPLHVHNQAGDKAAKVAALVGELERRALLPAAGQAAGLAAPAPFPEEGNPFDGASPAPIGRDAEIRRIIEKLQRGHCSLVGAAGSGKSLLLRAVRERAAALPGWGGAGETLALNCGLLANLSQLQQEVAARLGVEAKHLSAQLRRQPPRLLLLDDLGGMDRGETGYKMRRWLRGLADDRGTRLLMVSHRRLDLTFAADDPARGSLLAALDTRPLELAPLAPADCLALIESRLAGSGWELAAFADLAAAPLQPRELLHRCAERADELLGAGR